MSRNDVIDIISQLLANWAFPREPTYLSEANLEIKMPEKCTAERSKGPPALDQPIPDDLREFWTHFSSATLFEDVNYGQWGLRLLDYDTSNIQTQDFFQRRPQYAMRGDRVIGEFIGDLDLLIMRCDSSVSDFGNILVAIDDGSRNEWYRVANRLSTFLEEYASYDGQHYWIPQFKGRRNTSE